MIKVITKYGTQDIIKANLLKHFIKTGYVVAIA